ncbi:MAG: hypothetical protein AAB577_00840 [Patescibacteria group bacterium]
MSETMVMGPIVSALVKSEDILGKNPNWRAVKDEQAIFIKDFFSRRHEIAIFFGKELRSWASLVAAELNEVLQKEGFDIRLNDFGEKEFGVVSILNILVEWLEKGTKINLLVKGKRYPAIRLESGFEARESLKYSKSIAVLNTKSGDQVFMTVADRPYEGFELISRIEEISNGFMLNGSRYDSLTFPMVDLNHEVNIGWLKGMWTRDQKGDEFEISQALQQTKFKMNEAGARVKSAVALGVRFVAALPTRSFIIDKPFFLWIRRPGMSVPVIYAYIDEADWKDPGSLEM